MSKTDFTNSSCFPKNRTSLYMQPDITIINNDIKCGGNMDVNPVSINNQNEKPDTFELHLDLEPEYAEIKSFEHKISDNKSVEHRISDHKSVEHRISDHKTAEHRISDSKLVEHRISDNKIVEHRISDNKSVEKSAENKSDEHRLAENRSVENKSAERKSSERENPELYITTETLAPLAMPEDVRLNSFEIHMDDVQKHDQSLGDVINKNSIDNLICEDIAYDAPIKSKSTENECIQEKVAASEFGIRWSMLTEVIDSGIKPIINHQEKILQEAMFEIMTSEAKYYSGLTILMEHYFNSYLFSPVNCKSGYVNPIDKHNVFSNIIEVMETSKKLLQDFEKRWQYDRPYLRDVCDILYEHSVSSNFKQYVIYIRNQSFQQATYQRLMESAIIRKEIQRLQEFEGSRGLSLDSYLLLPLQRLTRYKLLTQNVVNILNHPDINQDLYQVQIENAQKAYDQISKLLTISNQGKTDLDRKDLMTDLISKIDFPSICKSIPLGGKTLLKEGEYDIDSCNQKHGPKIMKRACYFILLLFNDVMIIAKRSGTRILVLDYCLRKDVVFTSHVSQMVQERKHKKNVYYVTDVNDDRRLRFYLQFASSFTNYLRDPIILKVKNSEEIDSWLKYLPDCNQKEVFDYSRPSNFNYWSTVKKLNVFSDA